MEAISKFWHRILLVLLKYIPYIIATCYLICITFSCFDIQLLVLPGIIYISPTSGILILLMSKVLKFCVWHRLPIYYCFCVDVLSTIDYKCGIPLSNINLLIIYMIITVIFILFGMYLKERCNRKRYITNNSESNAK